MSEPGRVVVGASWPFTGRAVEFRAARRVLDRDRVVVVAGTAGVGKSRLGRELVERAGRGAAIGVACASASSRDIPLGAFARWLSPLPGSEPDGVSDPLVTAVVRADAAIRAPGPRSVLLVDDAHMLDGVSATLVHRLAQDRALGLVLTVRTGEACPDAVTAIWKDGLAERVELEALSLDAVGELLSRALGGPLDPLALRRLHDSTRGNTLWLRHLVDSERAAGRLAMVGGWWVWHGAPVLSAALEQLITERIGTLEAGEHRALSLVALGEPVGWELLVELVPEDDVERLAHRGLVTVTVDGARSEVRLAHPLYGEVTRSRLTVVEARRLRGDLSRALGDTGGRRTGDELRRAVLDLDSDNAPSSTLFLTAAAQAIDLTDVALGERLLRSAIGAGGGFDARLTLGFVLSWLMRTDEADHEFDAAAAVADSDQQRARAVLARGYMLAVVLDREDEARRLAASDGVDASGTPFAETDALRAMLALGGGDVVPAVDGATDLLQRPGVSPQTITWASWVAAWGAVIRGGSEDGRVRELVVRGMDAARRAPETVTLLGNLGLAEIVDAGYSGRLVAAHHRLRWADDLPGREGAVWAAVYRGRLALDAGRVVTAARLIDGIRTLFIGSAGGLTTWFHAMIAQARATTGDVVGAAASLDAADRHRHAVVRIFDIDVELATAWIAAARGATEDAIAAAGRAAIVAASGEQRAIEVLARHAAVRFGDRGQAEPLAELGRVVDTPRARAAAAHAAGWATRDVDALIEAADRFEECGLLLAAADALAHAAVIARESGSTVVALATATRAAALAADECEGAVTPALAAARDRPAVRGRERDVAVLVAEGLTNREIAARLRVSVRTVESHVYRACTRLGLPDRAALGAVVLPAGRSRRDRPDADPERGR